jgi:hypothetical protein
MAARGLGLLSAARGDGASATAWLTEARVRCTRTTDRYQWVSAHVLDAVIGVALDQGDEAEATRLVDALASLAARGDMRELVVRAHLHRSRLGDPSALATARLRPPTSTTPPWSPARRRGGRAAQWVVGSSQGAVRSGMVVQGSYTQPWTRGAHSNA